MSTIPSTETHPVLSEDKNQKILVRSTSLDKIRNFTYITSQQYYIIPAILTYLRQSQSGLQSATEKTIFFFRSVIFYAILYKCLRLTLKLSNSLVDYISKSVFLLKFASYTIASVLIGQLLYCLYVLVDFTNTPGGLVFLVSSWFYIIYLNQRIVFFYKNNVAKLELKKAK